jgi:hypothetical protein
MQTELDTLLTASRDRALTKLPGTFAGDVLREIRLRGARGREWTWWGEVSELTRRPSLLAAGIGFALVVGVLTPVVAGLGAAPGPGSDFAIFSSGTMNLPSGLLAQRR